MIKFGLGLFLLSFFSLFFGAAGNTGVLLEVGRTALMGFVLLTSFGFLEGLVSNV
jgi:hypothetical protein